MMTEPTLDEVMKRLPKDQTQADREVMVKQARRERALWEEKSKKAAAKKAVKREGGE